MNEIYAQGDLLIEHVPDLHASGEIMEKATDGALVLAEGELTGHRHAIYDTVTMFRDDALARDIPKGLYVGHVNVDADGALVVHHEHAPISLPKGTYRVRRQRELDPEEARVVLD